MISGTIRSQDLRTIRTITVWCAAVGATWVALDDGWDIRVLQGALTGVSIALLNSFFEIWLFYTASGQRVRRSPFLVHVGVKTLVYSLVITGSVIVWDSIFDWRSPLEFGGDAPLVPVYLFGLGVGFVVNFLILVHRMLGRHVMRDFVTGRYHHPRRAERIFLLLDIEGSTAIAERLGEVRFLSFLNRFFTDLAGPVVASGGDVYKYVGDAALITWPWEYAVRDAACIRCFFELERVIARSREEYEREFGTVPGFRGAVHGGVVAAGEIGDVKQEIAFVGDVMNTVARLEDLAKREGQRLVVSGAVLEATVLPAGLVARELGGKELRGKGESVSVFAVAREAPLRAAAG